MYAVVIIVEGERYVSPRTVLERADAEFVAANLRRLGVEAQVERAPSPAERANALFAEEARNRGEYR